MENAPETTEAPAPNGQAPMPQTPEQALSIIAQAAYTYHGNRQDHLMIEQAVSIIAQLVNAPKPNRAERRQTTRKPRQKPNNV